jgi:superfamily II DNA or RNA helicase
VNDWLEDAFMAVLELDDGLRSAHGDPSAARSAADAMGRDALEAWTGAQGIRARLDDRARVVSIQHLDPAMAAFVQARGDEYSVADLHLGTVPAEALEALAPHYRRLYLRETSVSERVQSALRRAAVAHLDFCAAAARQRRAVDEALERLLRDRSPEKAHVVRFAELIANARAEASTVVAEPAPGLHLDERAKFDPGLALVSLSTHVYGAGGWGPLQSAEVLLARWELGEIELRCGCSGDSTRFDRLVLPAHCPHAALALRATLRLLFEPSSGLFGRISVPGWQRLVAALDALFRATPSARAPDERIAWRIELRAGRPELVPLLQSKRKKGGFTRGRRVAPYALDRHAARELDARDRGVIDLLVRSPHYQDAATLVAALRLLKKHPRLFLRNDDSPAKVEEASLRVEIEENADGFELGTWLGDVPIAPAELLASGQDAGFFVHLLPRDNRCLVGELPPAAAALVESLARHGGVIPRHASDELVRRLPALGEHVDVVLPKGLLGPRVECDDRFHLALAEAAPGVVDVSVRVVPFGGGPRLIPGQGLSRMTGSRGGRRVHVLRDLGAERERLDRVLSSPALALADAIAPADRRVSGDEGIVLLLSLLRTGQDAGELVIEWSGEPFRLAGMLGKSALRVEVSSSRDWLGVAGTAELDGEKVELAMLLDAARAGRRWVKLGPRQFALLEDALVESARSVADLVHRRERSLALSPALALAFETALAGATLEGSSAFSAALERARGAPSYEPSVPKALRGVLRPYQVDGYRWLARMARWGVGACLADDMGLGKTVQCLGLLLERAPRGPALVVAPTSLGYNWLDEAARFAPGLNVRLYRGKERASLLEKLGPGDVLVTSYEIAARDAERLSGIELATLVLDEAQNVKNALTERARAMRTLRAEWRVALTGTPLENRLSELWGLFDVIEPGLLGGWEEFSRRFARPIEVDGDRGRLDALSRLIRPFVLRRTKREVLPELPPRTERVQRVPLSSGEQELYETARLAALGRVQGGATDARIELLAALTRLRRLVCHPRLYAPESTLESSKLEALLEILDELAAEGRRALVFSQFTSFLELVREKLGQAGVSTLYLEGATPAKERARRVEAFQRGEADVFLISLKAGGTGLNLTAADCVIHLDPWWNPAVEDQATDRAHRIGQESTVTVIRLVAAGTIEELVLELHGEKRALAAGVLDGTDTGARLTNDDLVALLERGFSALSANASEPPPEPPAPARDVSAA